MGKWAATTFVKLVGKVVVARFFCICSRCCDCVSCCCYNYDDYECKRGVCNFDPFGDDYDIVVVLVSFVATAMLCVHIAIDVTVIANIVMEIEVEIVHIAMNNAPNDGTTILSPEVEDVADMVAIEILRAIATEGTNR